MRPTVQKILAAALVLALVTGAAGARDVAFSPRPLAAAAPVVRADPTSAEDLGLLRQGLTEARAGDSVGAEAVRSQIADPTARKLVQWAMVDGGGERMAFFALDQARRDLWGWPRAARREAAAERQLASGGLSPQRTIDWFEGERPRTLEGAAALAEALQAAGKMEAARTALREAWAGMAADVDAQQTTLERLGGLLHPEDHVRRLGLLLDLGKGAEAQALFDVVPAKQAALARTRLAYQAGAANAETLLSDLPSALREDPGLSVDRARYLRLHDQEGKAASLLGDFPGATLPGEAGKRVWRERWGLAGWAMRERAWKIAYQALDNHGLPPGADFAEAEFTAGWIALRKQGDPVRADRHFVRLQQAGSSPITMGRALYWRGRAHEAEGDLAGARAFYGQAARYPMTFYGQIAAEKAGIARIALGRDPVPTAADRARFEGRELVRAARMLGQLGERNLLAAFVLTIGESLPNAEENALLVDLARDYNDEYLAMRTARAAAQRGYVMPERAYPLRSASEALGSEPALILAIVRQESGFDPRVRSGAGARGMMQLMPGTAQIVAARLGLPYSLERLDDPDYNLRLGSAYVAELKDRFGGSYVLAAAGYNAGPGRPASWLADCGDPRPPKADPTDFIECIPFAETRNYVMRVLEGAQVYRARLNGGEARLTLAADLKRGG